MRTLFPVSSLSLLLLGAVVPIGIQDQSSGKPSIQIRSKESTKKTLASMQGAWKLAEFKTRTNRDERQNQVGYCVISGNYLAIEVHLWWLDDTGTRGEGDFFTGIHRFELDEVSNIQTSSIITSFIDKYGHLAHDEPGETRHYHVDVSADTLRLTRDDDQILTFERLGHGEQKRDIFGRPIVEKSEPDEHDK